MIISVASGKGGTGKTTVAVNLALSLENVQLLDCDVEEPNVHIFLKPNIQQIKKASILVPEIDTSLCNFCGKCAKICAYNALAVLLDQVLTFHPLCHGCGGCALLCPQNAISEVAREIGVVEIGEINDMQFVHGKLTIGEAMAPPLIREVKKCIVAQDSLEEKLEKTVVIDAPPGTSCPVIETVRESDYCILVTEPTPFGYNDLVLAIEVLKKLKIPFGVIINRADIGDNKVDLYCEKNNIPVLMRIPFDREIASLYSRGIPIVKEKTEYKEKFQKVFHEIRKEIL